MFVRKNGVIRKIDDTALEKYQKLGYKKIAIEEKQEGVFDINTAKAKELRAYAKEKGYEEIVNMSGNTGADALREKILEIEANADNS